MTDAPVTNVVQLTRSYRAKLQRLTASGLDIRIAGTLDGYIDLAVMTATGEGLTYSLTCDDARQLIAALHGVLDDIRANCLYDRDPLLLPGDRA